MTAENSSAVPLARQATEVPLESIEIPEGRLRRLRDPSELAESMGLIGQLENIVVTQGGMLVVGRHRLEAALMLGWETIRAHVVEDDALTNRLYEIDENLKRQDLNVLEYGEHLTERESVLEALGKRAESGGTGSNQHSKGEQADHGDPPALTTADIAKEINKSRGTVNRYKRVAERITPEAREAIHELDGEKDLPRSTGQLLALADVESEHQLAVVELVANGQAESVWDAIRKLSGSVHFSTTSPDWHTPTHIIQGAIQVLGEIDLDPCADMGKSVPAAKHYTFEDDGLLRAWSGRVYMNPPYGSAIGEWVRKLKEEYEGGGVKEAIALVPARTDTEWFGALRDYPRLFVKGRLKFSQHQNSAPFPSCLFYLGDNGQKFVEAFDGVGDVFGLVRL